MKTAACLIALALLSIFARAQSASAAEPKSATVPITLDHDRVVIDVYLSLPDGSTKRIRGWVDNGDSELELSRRVATLLKLDVTCSKDNDYCSAAPPDSVTIGGMKISLRGIAAAKIPLKTPSAAAVMEAGMSAEITIPSTVLRHYDVLVNFPDREFTLAQPGTLKFKGVSAKALVNPDYALIQIPSQIEGKKYNLALDLGSSISFLFDEVFDGLAAAHPNWPHMTGAVGPANLWGMPDEAKWKVMRVEHLHCGPLFLTSVPVVRLPPDWTSFVEKRAGVPTAGTLGSQALLNYRVGLDYAHSTVYFDIGSTFKFPDFDVIGLILRPEDDTRFTILGVADFDGKPSVPTGPDAVQPGDHLVSVDGIPIPDSTMGQAWSLLEGSPAQERKLVVERDGKQIAVTAQVQHFLGEATEEPSRVKKK